MKDDCMGLAQQIAYSSLLAFFPAMAFLVGALGLFHLFDDLKSLLDPIAPDGVIEFISGLQRDSGEGTSAAAFSIGLLVAIWAASGAMKSVRSSQCCLRLRANHASARITPSMPP